MALKLPYETNYGLTCSDAYWRIKRCQVDIIWTTPDPDDEDSVSVKQYFVSGDIETWVTKADCDSGKSPIGGGTYRMPLDMEATDLSNVVAESYKWLKTQPTFTDAVDA